MFVFYSLFLLCCKLKKKDEVIRKLKRELEEDRKQQEEHAKVS